MADGLERHRYGLVAVMLLISAGAARGYLHVPAGSDDGVLAQAPETSSAEPRVKAKSQQRATSKPSPPGRPVAQTQKREERPDAGEPTPATKPAARHAARDSKVKRRRRFDQDTTTCFFVVEVDDLFAPAAAQAVRDVVAAVEELEHVEQVFWVDRVPSPNLLGISASPLPPDNASLQRFQLAKKRAMEHPLLRGQLLSADGKTLLMPVWFDMDLITSEEDCVQGLLETARSAAAGYPNVPLRIRLTGRAPLYLGARRAIDQSHLKFQIIGYSLVLLLAILLFRGVSAVFIVAGGPALAIFWSIGWLRLFEQLDNPLTGVVLPVLISMVGFTDGVHLIVHIRAARTAGASPMEAAKSAIGKVGLACALTSLTTAIGFSSLMLAESELVQGFGRACAVGVILTFFAVIGFIPLISTTWLGRNVQRGHERDFVGSNLRRLSPLIEWVAAHRRGLALFGFVATLMLGWFSLRLHPDDRLSDSQPLGSEAYQALAHCDEAFGGIEVIEIRVRWSRQHAADSPEVLAAIADAEAVLSAEPLVQNTLSFRSLLDLFPGADNAIVRTAYLALLPETLRQRYLHPEARKAAVTTRIRDLGIATYQPVFSRIDKQLEQLNQEHPGFYFYLDGDPVRRSRKLYGIVVDLTKSLGTASVVILLVVALAYRSWTIGLITMVPNMFPLAVTATFLIVTNQPLEIASVCSFTVCLGIAVDDSIHFLTRYQEERRQGNQPVAAVRRTFIGVGTALITTTLVLIAGFGTVLTSDLPGHRTFASMACWTISAALVADLVFLPAILLCFDRAHVPAANKHLDDLSHERVS